MGVRTTLLVGATAVAVLCGTAHAATLKVGPGKAYATITDAVTAASAGDKILVYKARYTETVTVAGKGNLVLQAKKGVERLPGLWGETCLTLSQGADGARVQGFTFRTTGTGLLLEAVNDVAILKCRFRGADRAIDAVGDGVTVATFDVRRATFAARTMRYASSARTPGSRERRSSRSTTTPSK